MKVSAHSLKVLLSFDVELFFGRRSGTIEKCIIEPVEALLAIGRRRGIRFTFFVDAGMLDYLWTKAKGDFLSRQRDSLSSLLLRIGKEGHDIELHIHPNWMDASWEEGWILPTTRFTSTSFEKDEYATLFSMYKKRLEEIAEKRIIAFRAGGFCLPPAEQLRQLFGQEGIVIDSSIYPGGYEYSATHSYDFRGVPHRGWWRFGGSPLDPQEDGAFFEVPVSSFFFRSLDFLKILAARKLGKGNHMAFGDGSSSPMSLRRKLTYLCVGALAPASVDNGKSSWLDAYQRYEASVGNDIVHVMGHPKAISRASLRDIENMLGTKNGVETTTISEYWKDIAIKNE